jgi:hypothetical protein
LVNASALSYSALSLNVASISPSIGITIEAECGIVIGDRPEVGMTSEASGLGGFHVYIVESSPPVFTGHFSDLDSSLNV